MKFQILIFLTICFSCLFSEEKQTVESEIPENKMAEIADLYFTKLTELGDFNGVVLMKKKNEVILSKAYNMSSDSTSTLFVSENSQFDLRSIAKLFAKLSVIQLEKEGKLSQNNKLSDFLPDFPNGDQITIHHLMTNTSGLPRSFEASAKPYIELSPEEVVDLASKSKLEFEPGEKELYSNIGFQLLYYSLGKVTNSTFEDYINRTFFEPLEMFNSGSNFYEGKDRKQDYAYGHFEKNNEIVCECTFPDDEMKMGNLFSTVDDLNNLLSSLDPVAYQDLLHDNIISHAGGTRGKRAYIERNFVDNYTLVFLANFDGIPFEQLVKDLQSILKGESVNMPEAINRSAIQLKPEILKRYEGTYDLVEAGHILLNIRFENDSLYVYQKGKNNGVILPESKTVFFSDKTNKESIEFVKNNKGTYDLLIDFQGVQWKGINTTNEN
ncbi:serine hydrolase domain-containing protein [Algoriphagus halophilus]|uniref:Beta-lactamase n=1 Tax=Algoriphagus halophilus TaxID=226505 RepID=A0A1N6HW03_9BACT|nr:serine hydrolase domain-containing protein [Algoriphagus halophilus]SIO23987.1 Beta-lactamase [Algoriphagus halophilus]